MATSDLRSSHEAERPTGQPSSEWCLLGGFNGFTGSRVHAASHLVGSGHEEAPMLGKDDASLNPARHSCLLLTIDCLERITQVICSVQRYRFVQHNPDIKFTSEMGALPAENLTTVVFILTLAHTVMSHALWRSACPITAWRPPFGGTAPVKFARWLTHPPREKSTKQCRRVGCLRFRRG